MTQTQWIRKNGKTAQGKQEYIEYLENKNKLSPMKAIKANCYQCMNSYVDGKNDCEISDCPLYPYKPYRKDKIKSKRILTEKQKESLRKLISLRSGTRRIASGSN